MGVFGFSLGFVEQHTNNAALTRDFSFLTTLVNP